MQRQFSSRGEALAEVNAARARARRQARITPSLPSRLGGRPGSEQWYMHPSEAIHQPKKAKPRPNTDGTPVL